MSNAKLTALYSSVQGFYWMGYAVIMGFINLYLLESGFSSSTIGVLIAAACLLSALLQPVLAGRADRLGSHALKRILTAQSFLTCAGAMGLIFLPRNPVLTALLYALVIVCLQTALPMVNSLAVLGSRKPSFGIARSGGSIAYAAASYMLGALAERFGSGVVPAAMAVAFTLLLGVVLFYPLEDTKPVALETKVASGGSFLRRYPRFAAVLVGCILLFLSHVLLNTFFFQITVHIGGGSEEMGIAMALCAITEIPTMCLFGLLLKIMKCHSWFKLSGIFFFLKNLGTLLAWNIPSFYAVQLLQILAFAVITVSSVYYINSIMDSGDAVKGQAYYASTLTLANVIGSVLGGWLLDAMGVPALLAVGTVCAGIGAVILLLFTQETNP